MRIAVIGYSGSGKSTFAARLARKYGYPLMHLDRVNYIENWKERERSEAEQIARDFLKNDCWIVDGNYRKLSMDERMKMADRIVFFDFPRLLCLWRAYKRARAFRGRVRDSMAEGCIEKLDWEFVRWILRDGRSAHYKNHYRAIINRYPGKVTVFRFPWQVARFWRGGGEF